MVDKTIGGLTEATSVVAGDKFEIENGAGNSRHVLASALKTYASAEIASDLAAHIADETTHGISTFMATLTGAANLTALLTLLEITSPATNTLNLPFNLMLQWGRHAVGTSGASAIGGTFSLNTAFADANYYIVGSMDGRPQAPGLWSEYTVSVGPDDVDTAHFDCGTANADEPIEVARNLVWAAIGTQPA